MKHLFKLTKDGKCVGYMQLERNLSGNLEWRWYDEKFAHKSIYSHHFFDQAHPYVTDDKNGEPVFEEDVIGANNIAIDGKPYRQGIVTYEDYGWGVSILETLWEPMCELDNIELLKDKERQDNHGQEEKAT
jgi:hypothetical protein